MNEKFYKKKKKISLVNKVNFINNKRGIAPLISTIILILFATGLGIIVMNWGSEVSYAKEESIGETSINVIEINGKKDACFKDNVLYFTLENDGENTVNGLKVSFIGDEIFQKDVTERLFVGDIKKVNVEYEGVGNLLKVKIVPLAGGKTWTKQSTSIENIEAC